jgi:hypothetical protein
VYTNLNATTPNRPYSIVLASPGGARADWFLDNVVDTLGNIYLCGFTTGNLQGTHLGEGDAFIVKYDSTLSNPIFKQFGTNRGDAARSISIDKEGNLYAVGYTYGNYSGNNAGGPGGLSGDILVQKFDANLNLTDKLQIGTPAEDRAQGRLVDSILYIGGTTEGSMCGANNGSFDGYLFAINKNTFSIVQPTIKWPTAITNVTPTSNYLEIYPNPAQHVLNINSNTDYQIYTIAGILLANHSSNQKQIDLSKYASGLYLVKSGNTVKRFFKEYDGLRVRW